jgi:TrmH family RNA methyltransferase
MDDVSVQVSQLIEQYKSKVYYAGVKNRIIKKIEALINNSKPNPNRMFILEGIWAFNMAFKSSIEIQDFIFCPECLFSNEAFNLAQKAMDVSQKVHIISKKVLDRISERDKPDGIIAICKFPETKLSNINIKESIIVVLDGIEIPGNIGTILRSCDGANIDAVFICNKRARLTHPKLIKGSMGSAFFIPIVVFDSVTDCKEWLSKNRFTFYLADTRADKNYRDYDYEGNVALVVGSERYGITKEWYQCEPKLVSIPMLGQCDSLNVAIAATIILYEMRLKKC